MSLSDDDKKALRDAAAKIDPLIVGQVDDALGERTAQVQADLLGAVASGDPDALGAAHDSAKRLLAELDDRNSVYPATREFLRSRGVEKVSQLDERGMAELRLHLETQLTALTKGKA